MDLRTALRLDQHRTVAVVGAGGKSALLKRLASELQQDGTVLLTTSTKLALTQSNLAAHHLVLQEESDFERIPKLIKKHRSLLVTCGRSPGEPKWLGLRLRQLDRLLGYTDRSGSWLLIEADGSKGRSLKAPAGHEPVIPEFIDLVVPMAGIDVIGRPLADPFVHRPQVAAAVLGIRQGTILEVRHVAAVLGHPQGGLKDVPPGAHVRVLLNKVETGDSAALAAAIGQELAGNPRVHATIIGSLKGPVAVRCVLGRVAGVILAAGGSRRLRISKQLIPWQGKTLVWHAVRAAVEANLSPVAVVLGAEEAAVRGALEGQPVRWVRNPNWKDGQSGSVCAGLQAVRAGVEGIVFLLTDMPFVSSDLVRALVMKHRETLCNVAPMAEGRRGNPVLFDRSTFEALSKIQGDRGGRQILSRFQLIGIPWNQESQFDLDSEEDLRWLEAQNKSQL
jgi:molybdenum cofactor cytidylyltransferase